MDILSLTAGLANTLTALLTIGLAIPLLRGKVERNTLYGVRLSESFASEEAWVRINRYGAKRLILWSVPVLLIGAVAFFVPMEGRPVRAMAFGLAPLLIVGAAFETVAVRASDAGGGCVTRPSRFAPRCISESSA